jgi:immune inhibitor A
MWWSGGAHGKSLDKVLTLAPQALASGATLHFDTWYRIESADAEAGLVEVSTDGGSTWAAVTGTSGGSPITSDDYGLGQGLQGISMGWRPADYDLSAYAGQTVTIRFRFHAPGMTYMKGWAVDNVVLSDSGGTVFSDDVDSGVLPAWATTHTGEVASGYPADWAVTGMQ